MAAADINFQDCRCGCARGSQRFSRPRASGADRTAQGLAFTIENRTGTGGIIGAEAVSRSAPDGSTLLMDSYSLLIDVPVQKTN